jgi:hypothetical protein
VENNRKFYVYVHRRKSDGSVFYVGKGTLYRATTSVGRNRYWHRIANKHGWVPEIVFPDLTEFCALSIEKILIYAFHGKISNATDGGEGVSGLTHSDSTKAKLKVLADKQWSDPRARSARSEATKRQWSDPAMRDRLKASAKARWEKPGQREMVSATQLGRKQSPEHAAKSRIAKLGKPVSDETREKLRQAWVLRKARNAAK